MSLTHFRGCKRLFGLFLDFRKCTSSNYIWSLLTPPVRVARRTLSLPPPPSFSLPFERNWFIRLSRGTTRDTPSSGSAAEGSWFSTVAASLPYSFPRPRRKNAGHFPNVYNEYALTAAWVMRLRPRKGVIFARRRFPPSPWRRIIFCRSSTKNGIRDGDDNEEREKHAVFSVVKLSSLFVPSFRGSIVTRFSPRS